MRFTISATVEAFDAAAQSTFLGNLATLAGTAVSNLYIKSVSGASLAVVVGVLPAAAVAVDTQLASKSTAELTTSLGVTVESVPAFTMAPSSNQTGGNGGSVGIIVGCIVGGLAVLLLISYVCYKKTGTEPERRVSLMKMDSAGAAAGRPENALDWAATNPSATKSSKERALALSDEKKDAHYTAQV